MTQDFLPDRVWVKIAKAGGLTDDFRVSVANDILNYRRAIICRTISKPTRLKVQQTAAASNKLSRLVEHLALNREYLLAGTDNEENAPPDLNIFVRVVNELVKLEEELKLAKARLDEVASSRDFTPLQNLVYDLLATRAKCLKTSPPTSPTETFMSNPFRKFIELCVEFADGDQLTSQHIENAIIDATYSLDRVRTMDLDAWARNWGLPPVAKGDGPY